MYLPAHFREDDLPTLQAFIRENSFGILVTQREGAPEATHLPFLYDAERGPYGTLIGHIALANQQWQAFDGAQEGLAIFSGPHAYITPSWYEVELSVPTWNYAAIHAYGKLQRIDDPSELYALLKNLIQLHESQFEHPWTYPLPEEYVEKMMRGVVGFTMPITRLEGKYKMSQNRNENEQKRVIAELQETSPQVAQTMQEVYRRKRGG
ncbi:MAG TPA: FMN-binding negative transcriptional regulator [Ktedonobacteraceae bacterium]|nr:FMN-binding negative transcriptional regulator [Ktedonobacteraceae bacterium]